MTEKALAVVDKGKGQLQAVSDEIISSYLESFGNKLDPKYRKQFIQICKAFQLNPFIREIYGIPFGDKFNIIVGYEVYLKRAERSGLLAGWRAWTEGQGKDLKGCVEILRKDWTQPFTHEVHMAEYDQGNSMWKSKPHTMIKKVAIAQGFRLAFPEELGGMPYTADEIPGPETVYLEAEAPHTEVEKEEKKEAAAAEKPKTGQIPDTTQGKVYLALRELCKGDKAKMAEVLKEVSEYKGKFFTVAEIPKMTEARAGVVLGKLRKMIEDKAKAAATTGEAPAPGENDNPYGPFA